MSIWSSIDHAELRALDGQEEAANYRAEGDPSLIVDVAFTEFHDHLRLAIWDDDLGIDVAALLSPEAAAQLRDRLSSALARRAPKASL